jgi:hypothetical protein
MLSKLTTISDSANTVFTFIRCQMPYAYVRFVSFTVHLYLVYWASYIGAMLHVGIPDGSVTQSAEVGSLNWPTYNARLCDVPLRVLDEHPSPQPLHTRLEAVRREHCAHP